VCKNFRFALSSRKSGEQIQLPQLTMPTNFKKISSFVESLKSYRKGRKFSNWNDYSKRTFSVLMLKELSIMTQKDEAGFLQFCFQNHPSLFTFFNPNHTGFTVYIFHSSPIVSQKVAENCIPKRKAFQEELLSHQKLFLMWKNLWKATRWNQILLNV
jgi:hypothetical protein